MARTTQSGEQLDLENMNDEQLRELRTQVDRILDTRVRSRFDEYRRAAREAGYEAAFTRIGEEVSRRRRGRPGAPSDGFGHIRLSDEDLVDPVRLDREASAAARDFSPR
jgi:hypothetical protein